MSNQIDANGIQINTYAQTVSDIVNGNANAPGFVQIYGSDIQVESNSPDGQMINIFALAEQDTLQLLVAIYNSFNPDAAVGVSLDSISQIAGLVRKAGVYTQVVVNVVASSAINLSGLDTASPYTVSDANGNLFYLITSASLLVGSNPLNFQAANVGFIQVLANTITQQVTIVAGVTSVNNPAIPYQQGSNQETDANFRLRRQASTSFPAQGPLQALYAGLNAIPNINQAVIYENITNSTDGDGIPAHSIWVICDGGDADDIGEAIYRYRSLGIGMKGAVSVNITQIDGSIFVVKYDVAVNQNLYLRATLTSINGGSIDNTAIKDGLVQNYLFTINQEADITTLDGQIRAINPNVVCSVLGVSADGSSWVNLLSPTVKKNKFVLDQSRITLS